MLLDEELGALPDIPLEEEGAAAKSGRDERQNGATESPTPAPSDATA